MGYYFAFKLGNNEIRACIVTLYHLCEESLAHCTITTTPQIIKINSDDMIH